jgi:3-hydroxymyristoyl/3-hydroxydecanoyl-(acyl carrier protein) dehydratase
VIPTVDIRPGPAFFEGHFPGQPILPGVALLHLAAGAIAQARGKPIALRGIPHARLRQLVAPGDCLSLSVREEQGDRLRVELHRGEERVANGEFELGPPYPPPAKHASPAEPQARAEDRGLPPLDLLLPHRPPMRFVSALREEREDGLSCEVCVPAQCALVTNGVAPALATVEAVAQTAAAWEALRRAREGGVAGPRIGYLVALREVVFFAAGIQVSDRALAMVRLDAVAPPLTHYRFEASSGGRMVSSGSITTYLAAPQITPGRSRGA